MLFSITKNRRTLLITAVLLLIGAGLLYAYTAYGVTRTWDGGGGDANWNTAANWSGDTAPTSSDIASFDGTCASNCSPTVNVAISVAGINMAVDYAGTITQSTTNTITVGSSHWAQAGGTFTGGSGAITISGTFTLSGGTFTSTTGTLTVSSSWTHTAGGTFNHNNGTVTLSSVGTINVATSETFYNLTKTGNIAATTITSGDTLIVTNTLTHTDGYLQTGTIEAQGNVVVASTADTGSTATISFLVAGDQTITASSGWTGKLSINKPSGTVSASGDLGISGYTLSSGTFTSTSGTLTIVGVWTHTAGGTFNHNNGTVKFYSYAGSSYAAADVAVSETFNNLTVDLYNYAHTLTIASGDTLVALGLLTINDGSINTGTIEAQGNVVVGAAGTAGGTATVSFLVSGDQTITSSGGTICNLSINKPSGTVSVSGNFGMRSFTLASGTFTSTTGTLTISSGAWTHTAGGTFNHNNGTVKFYSYYGSGFPSADVATTETFNHLTVDLYNSAHTLTIASGDTLVALGTLTLNNGAINTGTVEAQGNVVIGASMGGGTTALSFTGSNAQTYTDQGGNEPNGDVTINKTSGTVTLASNADWNATSQDLTITSGTLSSATYNVAMVNFTVNGGTFTGGSGTVTTTGPLVVSSGTFTGGAGNITVNNTFTLSGGTFTSTSGTLTINFSGSTSTIFTISSGTFNHNNGTVNFSPGEMNYIYTVDVATSLTLYDVVVSVSSFGNGYLTVASGDTIIVTNNVIHTDGRINGAWQVEGNVTIGAGADGGDGTLTMTGTGSKTYTYSSGGIGPHLRVNNAALSVTANTGTTALRVTAFSLLAGTFIAPTGTLTIDFEGSTATIFTVSSGTFNHNNVTIDFSPSGGNYTYTVDVATSLTLYNVIINAAGNGAAILAAAAGDTIIANNFTHTDGLLNGAWQIQGNATIATTADGGTGTLTYTGPNDQTYTDQGGNEPDGDITINKTSGTVTLASNADWNATSQDLTITSGILSMGASYTIATTALTVSTAGTLLNPGTGDLTLGGTVANAGRILMQKGSCANADSVLIRSSVAGTQRSWNGAGTFTLTDVDVKDMAGSASITAYSSTNTGNNGANWTFDSGCVAPPPVASFPSSKFTFPGGKINFR